MEALSAAELHSKSNQAKSIEVSLYLQCYIDLILKNFVFRGNSASHNKMLVGKVVCLKNIYKFSIQHFLVGSIIFDLNIKSDIENTKGHVE